MRNYDYTSANSKLMMKQIKQTIVDCARSKSDATQANIARALDTTVTTVSRYLAHMCEEGIVHVAVPSKAKSGGHLPAIYKPGAGDRVLPAKRTTRIDPLLAAFYGKSPQ